jgi:outer membrane receptor protein involved in Fe transport
MNLTNSRRNSYGAQLATLLGTTSLLTMAGAIANQDRAYAGEATEEIPENVLITGSLIRGTVAVGVPVVNLSPMDFAQTGSLTTADLFKNFGAANVDTAQGTASGARIERGAKVNLRGLDTGSAVRSLMMVDGMRFPPQSNGLCAIDPSVIPSISLDHIDILVDGASATYGSDAISGVINLVLRRNYDGAMSQLRYTSRVGGGSRTQFGQLWGRTWDGGQITMSYEWYEESPSKGNAISNFDVDHSPWGFNDRTPIGSSTPGTITRSPFPSSANQLGTQCGFNTGVSPNTSSSCYAIPQGTGANFPVGSIGPTSPYSASTLNWATFSNDTNFAGPLNPSAGTRNQFNPYSRVYYDAAQQRNGGAITIDQRLTKDISFYGSSFYSNRRAKFLVPSNQGPAANNVMTLVAIPTTNPYYPTGGAPTNLRVSYDIGVEAPGQVDAYELASRYQVGLNIALPAGWESQIFYAETYDSSYNHVSNSVNKAAVSAALGWTINPVAASGTAPSFGTWTKPANVPYLNLFCDPTQFLCNSQTTLNYISGYRSFNERFWINEKGIKADGPLFDLPGGTVKMAIGANLSSSRFNSVAQDNTGGANLTINPQYDPESRFVWATFAQINIPVFSDMNAIFGFRRFDLEASWRHDQYSDVGGTSNPKIAFNWSPIDDFTIKGAWGSNFRAPNFGENSPVANVAINGWNMGGGLANSGNTINACSNAGDPLPGATSGAGKLQSDALNFNNAMAAAGVTGYTAASGCIDALMIPDPVSYTDSAGNVFTAFASPGITSGVNGLVSPQGMTTLGGANVSFPIRQFTGNGLILKPELATNWGIGFDYAPTNFLRGLDIQATYYIVKLNGALRGFGNPNDARFQDPTLPFAFPAPSDIGCPDLPNSARPSIPIPANLVPSACPQWMTAIDGILANPRAAVDPAARTLVYWLNDGGTFNQGWQKLDGIDWNFSYDWDMGNIGAFNVGATGTYYLHNYGDNSPGQPGDVITNGYHTTTGSSNALSEGVPTLSTLRYRGRLGWSNGPWNVTGFMDYQSHYYHTQSAPPNVNGNFCTSTAFAAPAGGTFPCFNDHYNNLLPSWYSFDLTIGYDTGEEPANNYLKNIGLQLVIQNIFDKGADYQYRTAQQGGQPCTCDILRSLYGRQVSFVVTKTW